MTDKNKIHDLHGDRDDALERLYAKAGKAEPKAELDSVILKAAHRANSRSVQRRYPWFAGIAASILVGIIFLRIYPESVPTAEYDHDAIPHDPGMQSSPAGSSPPETMPMLKSMDIQSPDSAMNHSPEEKPAGTTGDRQKRVISKEKKLPLQYRELTEPQLDAAGASARGYPLTEALPAAQQPASAVPEYEMDEAPETLQAESAESELSIIRSLIERGDIEEARQRYDRFKEQYPDFPVRPELVKQLEQQNH